MYVIHTCAYIIIYIFYEIFFSLSLAVITLCFFVFSNSTPSLVYKIPCSHPKMVRRSEGRSRRCLLGNAGLHSVIWLTALANYTHVWLLACFSPHISKPANTDVASLLALQ